MLLDLSGFVIVLLSVCYSSSSDMSFDGLMHRGIRIGIGMYIIERNLRITVVSCDS